MASVNWLPPRKKYEYGWGGSAGRLARRELKTGAVEFILHVAGTQGFTEDYWHPFDSSWWPKFQPFNEQGSSKMIQERDERLATPSTPEPKI